MEQREKRINTWALALGIAAMPPLWAVLAPYVGVTCGAVALICAGLFVANGNKYADTLKISIGFLLGDAWAVLALLVMDQMPWNPDVELYVTLFVMGGVAVLVSSALEKFIFLPAWLCGWAVGLTILAPVGYGNLGSLPVQIGAAMLAGVIYVGIGVDVFQRKLVGFLSKKQK